VLSRQVGSCCLRNELKGASTACGKPLSELSNHQLPVSIPSLL
jgi:hypothetical protein